MTFTQILPITAALKAPFWLTKVPVGLSRKCSRKKISCGYRAVAELKALKLDPAKYYGADVADSRGTIVAEVAGPLNQMG